jgi:quercetin dioxygenase-like cupin family protein
MATTLRAIVVRGKGIKFNRTYTPDRNTEHGIDSSTVENPEFVMSHSIAPPGSKTPFHYHVNCAVGVYIIKGRLRCFSGPKHDRQVVEIEAGDYIYHPRGEIHGAENVSNTEPVEYVFVYGGIPSTEATGRGFVEPPVWTPGRQDPKSVEKVGG